MKAGKGAAFAAGAVALILWIVSPARPAPPPTQGGMWEILPFPEADSGDPMISETVDRLRRLAEKIDNSERRSWLKTESEWRAWIERHSASLDTSLLVSPWGVPVEYIFTDLHHSYTLNAYDTAGRIAVAYLGGASHRVGPIPFQAPALMRTPVGVATDNFIWNRDAWASPVCHLIADAMREEETAEIALLNFLAVRAPIPKGTVTREHLGYVLPFGNRAAAAGMTGAQIARVIESSIDSGIPFTVSGIRRTGRGSFVTASGRPLGDSQIYRVTYPDYLAQGGRYGDYMSFRFFPLQEASGKDIADLVASYIKRRSSVSPDTHPRLGLRPANMDRESEAPRTP